MDIKLLTEQLNQIVTWSQDITEYEVDTSPWVEVWSKNKQRFIDLFGGNLIYEVPEPIQFELSSIEKDRNINSFVSWINGTMDNSFLASFIDEQREGFFENRVVKKSKFSSEPQVGMKLLKAFRFFEDSEEALREIQDRASMIIQQTKVEGTLCFSVHPLDFMSLSENASNWRSCHALDGDYRAGNISYMLDSSTFICYLKGKEEFCSLPNFPPSVKWNNKKWRVLLFADGRVEDEITYIMAGRQYPFTSINGLEIIRKWFMEINISPSLLPKAWSKWTNWDLGGTIPMFSGDFNPRLKANYVYWNGEMVPISSILGINEKNATLYFNDLISSSIYRHPYYMFKREMYSLQNKPLFIGQSALCPGCHTYHLCESNSLVCENCGVDSNERECEVCGHVGWDINYDEDLECYICDSCYENETFSCRSCGKRVFNCDGIFSRQKGGMICRSCDMLIKESN